MVSESRGSLRRDLEVEQVLSEQQIKDKELKRKRDILNFQFKDEIIQPVSEFVDNFNKISGSSSVMKISENSYMDDLVCEIVSFPGSKGIFYPVTKD